MSENATALELLEQIKPYAPKTRFLQSWDRTGRVLRYGCGDESKAVTIGSDGSLDCASANSATKLSVAVVRQFLAGTKVGSPFGEIVNLLRQHLYLPDERLYALFAAWISGSYFYSMFSHYGYLFLFSEQKRCGKTRAEELVSLLAFEATEPRNAPTAPAMRETAVAGGTAIFDTLERWRHKSTESFSAAMELLDAGFRNGGTVAKMIQTAGGDWRQELYPVYAPYVFAAIKRESLSDTALDRSFEIHMVRKSTKLRVKPCDAKCAETCAPVREALYLYALTNAARLADVYASAELKQRVDALGLTDRASDIWKPILAVTTLMQDSSLDHLCSLAVEMCPDDDRQEEFRQLRILSALRGMAGPEGTLAKTTQQLVEQLDECADVGEVCDLPQLLRQWGFEQKSLRLTEFDNPRKGWELKDADLAAAESRLRDGTTPSPTETTETTPEFEGRL